ncbi:MAG: glycosyltransferase family 2 protein [Blastocatellia bacterium]|nr:glycosyltransferase family 2 protein [Blastocatellia bacterium]
MGISAVIIAFNEEAKIGDCIRSVSWADEVVVVDSHSTDRTREIAEGLGARVIERDWPGFGRQKQFGADAAKNDLVLSIDADEIVSDELANEIQTLDLTSADAFRMPRLSHYLGKPIRHGSWYPDWQIRLFDRRKCHWSNDAVHESVIVPSGNIKDLSSDLLHFSSEGILHHAQMIYERYAPLGAERLKQQNKRVSFVHLLFSGTGAFVKGYFLKLGFLDGVRGLLIATFAGYNAFLKHAIRYEQQLNEKASLSSADTTDS